MKPQDQNNQPVKLHPNHPGLPYIKCPRCKSRKLTWHYDTQYHADEESKEPKAPYYLECDTCQISLRTIDNKSVAEILTALQASAKIPYKKPNKSVNPAELDWSMSTRELAEKHNVSLAYVWMYRRLYAPHTIPERNRNIDWSKVDWQQPTNQLMRSLGCAHKTIKKMRALHAPGTPDPEVITRKQEIAREQSRELAALRKKRKLKCWDGIDWSLATYEIIKLTGKSRPAVTQARAILAPETVKRRHKLPAVVDWSLTDEEIASIHGVALVTVYRGRIKAGRTTRQYQRRK